MTRNPLSQRLLHHIYIDESSQTKHRFLVIGGISVASEIEPLLERHLQTARLPELPHGEMKWTKVSASKLNAYKRFVDVLLDDTHPDLRSIEFHSLVVDTHKLKDAIYNRGSREIGFNKEIFQLCQKFGRINRTSLFHVYLDNRTTKSTTAELRDILNFAIRQKQPGRDWPYRRVHFRDSSDCLILQMVDLFIGAIAFKLNGHYAALGASDAKRALSDHILSLAGVRIVEKDTSVRGRFTIWHRQLR